MANFITHIAQAGYWGTEGPGSTTKVAEGSSRAPPWPSAPRPVPQSPPVTQLHTQQADLLAGKTYCWSRHQALLFNFFVLLSDFIPEPRWTWLLCLLTRHCEVKYAASPRCLRKINRPLSPPPTPTPTLPSELEIKNLQKDSQWLCQGGGMVRIGTVYNISALPDQSRFLIQ